MTEARGEGHAGDAVVMIETADIATILKALPHRYPFVMVDRIINIRGDESAIGIKNVTINEPQFVGHFPGNPVFPGVLLIEGMAQTAGVMCILTQTSGDFTPSGLYFVTIDKAKFRRPVLPGDTVEYHMSKIARKKNMWWYQGRAMVAGRLVAEAKVGATLS
jgi:3-hydroxyacyl-[acyl-carrier-protein] dehydratase